MTIDKSATPWRGDYCRDIDEILATYASSDLRVTGVYHAVCTQDCGGRVFQVILDEDNEYLERVCTTCRSSVLSLESKADKKVHPRIARCGCGGSAFEMAVGFSINDLGLVRWIYVGMRCIKCGALGVHADWKVIDGDPDLFNQV